MPKITLKDGTSFEAPAGKRLVLAIEDSGTNILHRCGGFARCTTCRVSFVAGEPDRMTQAELSRLQESQLLGKVRLSCQIPCDHGMTVEVINTLETSDVDDAGPRPQVNITPEPEWTEKPARTG